MLIVLTALLAGFLHVLSGPDHLTAIAPYATEGKTRAWHMADWGLGHSSGVIAVGFLLLLVRDKVGVEILSSGSEGVVGVMLMAIGLRGMRKALALGHEEVRTCWASFRRFSCRQPLRAPHISPSSASARSLPWPRPTVRAEATQAAIMCTCSTLAVVAGAYWLISTLPLASALAGAALI